MRTRGVQVTGEPVEVGPLQLADHRAKPSSSSASACSAGWASHDGASGRDAVPALPENASGSARARTAGRARCCRRTRASVPVEDVVLDRGRREVGVLDGADADRARDRGARPRRAARGSCFAPRRGALDRLVEQVASWTVLAGAGLERLPVRRRASTPNPTCSARAGGRSQPAAAAAAKTIGSAGLRRADDVEQPVAPQVVER